MSEQVQQGSKFMSRRRFLELTVLTGFGVGVNTYLERGKPADLRRFATVTNRLLESFSIVELPVVTPPLAAQQEREKMGFSNYRDPRIKFARDSEEFYYLRLGEELMPLFSAQDLSFVLGDFATDRSFKADYPVGLSPDGKRLIASVKVDEEEDKKPSKMIVSVELPTKEPKKLTDSIAAFIRADSACFDPASDHKLVVATVERSEGSRNRVCLNNYTDRTKEYKHRGVINLPDGATVIETGPIVVTPRTQVSALILKTNHGNLLALQEMPKPGYFRTSLYDSRELLSGVNLATKYEDTYKRDHNGETAGLSDWFQSLGLWLEGHQGDTINLGVGNELIDLNTTDLSMTLH